MPSTSSEWVKATLWDCCFISCQRRGGHVSKLHCIQASNFRTMSNSQAPESAPCGQAAVKDHATRRSSAFYPSFFLATGGTDIDGHSSTRQELSTQLLEGLVCDLLSIPDSPTAMRHLSFSQEHSCCHQPDNEREQTKATVIKLAASQAHAQWSACPTSCRDTLRSCAGC